MFGWFRKRKRHDETAGDAAAAPSIEPAAAGQPEAAATHTAPAASPAAPAGAPAPAGQSATPQQPDAAQHQAPAGVAPQQPAARQQAPADAAAVAPRATASEATQQPAPAAQSAPSHVTAPPVRASSLPIAAPSLRPAMPLSDNPNFAGLGLAQPDHTPPRLLEPEAALSDEARDELTAMLLDMFGPTGRYRLEWRANREPGDDAMFSEIMVADLVRRIQNSIAVASDLELRAAPLRLAIEAMHQRRTGDDDPSDGDADADASTEASDDTDADGHDGASADDTGAEAANEPAADERESGDRASAQTSEQARAAAIAEFVAPSPSLQDLAASTEPCRPHLGVRDEADRRIA